MFIGLGFATQEHVRLQNSIWEWKPAQLATWRAAVPLEEQGVRFFCLLVFYLLYTVFFNAYNSIVSNVAFKRLGAI